MIGNAEKIIRYLEEKRLDTKVLYEIKVHREKRSLNANAYAWSLITQIADILNSSKEEVYLEMLRSYGQSEIVRTLPSVDLGKYVKYTELIALTEDYAEYIVYKGSSEYDTKEMSILIDGIISECEQLEIETLPQHEIERIKGLWNQS